MGRQFPCERKRLVRCDQKHASAQQHGSLVIIKSKRLKCSLLIQGMSYFDTKTPSLIYGCLVNVTISVILENYFYIFDNHTNTQFAICELLIFTYI
jgi:hypothetical protein